jgi:hypothetical protein
MKNEYEIPHFLSIGGFFWFCRSQFGTGYITFLPSFFLSSLSRYLVSVISITCPIPVLPRNVPNPPPAPFAPSVYICRISSRQLRRVQQRRTFVEMVDGIGPPRIVMVFVFGLIFVLGFYPSFIPRPPIVIREG